MSHYEPKPDDTVTDMFDAVHVGDTVTAPGGTVYLCTHADALTIPKHMFPTGQEDEWPPLASLY